VKLSNILVPLKGLPIDEEILDLAFSLVATGGERRARQRGKIEVIHVVEIPQALALDAELPEAIQQGESVLAQAEQRALTREIEINAELLQARLAGVAIVEEAIARQADLIIMGTVYRRRHGEYYLGTTVPYVLKNAPCRVWLARAPRSDISL
jgi:nucleotide-binding universal stress UspA family protein